MKGSETATKPKKRRSLIGTIGRVVLGLALGLVIAEGVFRIRDSGAFPHANFYVPDPELGVRLEPGATERFRTGKNPVVNIRINAQGYRGADLPAPEGGEVIVVGDSQMFGLGVEEDQTASAELGRALGATVINAGVPTYGPHEYTLTAKALLEKYSANGKKPRALVYVVNFANDLFEASHDNTERHAVWDGWAVRKETAPERSTQFPGRRWLFSQSHAVYALRSLMYANEEQVDDRGFASEGSTQDLIISAEKEHEHVEQINGQKERERTDKVKELDSAEKKAQLALEETALDVFHLRGYELGEAYVKSRETSGDIVFRKKIYAEESRDAVHTATIIFNGAKVRREMEERIKKEVEKQLESTDEEHERLATSLEEREKIRKRREELKKVPLEIIRAWSPMTPVLKEVKALTDAHGVELVVVALPLDVMVSKDEWAKYGAKPSPEVADMADAKILIEDLVASAEAIGATAVDGTPALAAAEPGAFLDGDLHMTPKGQAALGQAIAAKLKR